MDEKNKNQDLAQLRNQIDQIDASILDLLNQRLEIGKAVGQIKKQTGAQVLDRSREQSVIERLWQINKGPVSKELLRYLFGVIITATREVQKPKTISFLGPKGSYTHIAALSHFSHSGEFVEEPNLYEVFLQVDKRLSQYGVVPIENSIEGSVNPTFDLFVDFNTRICGEYYEPISHDLLSKSGEAADVETICSHPQALAQCKAWIKKRFPTANIIEESSTSKAAQLASKDPRIAAIASRQAAHLYELQIVESKIEDYAGNVTRFLVIGSDEPERTGNDKTSIMFVTSHVPGALFKALAPLEEAGVNMLKLESRPMKNQRWSYYFFMDVEGHITDTLVQKTVEKIRAATLSLKILGSYPAFEEKEIEE